MTTLKEKVFNRITGDFMVLTREVFRQIDLIEKMLEKKQDEQIYQDIRTNEHIIDSLEVKIRAEVINAIVLYTPRATNLRIIISYYDMTAYLERVGDLIMNMAHSLHSIDMQGPLFIEHRSQLDDMFQLAKSMVQNSINAFTKEESDLAKQVIELDNEVDELYHSIGRGLPAHQAGKNLSEQDLLDILAINAIAYNIERIADNATNIAESAIYLIQGRNIQHLNHQDDAAGLIGDKE